MIVVTALLCLLVGAVIYQRSRCQRAVQEQVQATTRRLTQEYGQQLDETKRHAATFQRAYQDALQEKQQTTAILASIAEGLVVISASGDVVTMNPAAERLLAVHPPDRVGKPLKECLNNEQLLSLVQGSNEAQERTIVLNAKQESTQRILRASHAVITDESGKTVGMLATLTDVTKTREVGQLNVEFISTVGHELRTPLVAMRHALSILTDQVAGPLNAEQQNFAAIAQRNLDRLNALINELLDLKRPST